MRILGVDPGLRCTGVAEFSDFAGWNVFSLYPVGGGLLPLATRVNNIVGRLPSGLFDLVIVEKPQVYKGSLQKGDPNDLIDLALVVGAVVARYPNTPRILTPRPAEWKGQVPKEIHHRRIRASVPGLGNQSKDALDAVGLVLYGMELINAKPRT